MKKIRKYHYEAKFGVDQFSMRIFVALKKKLERDYLPFIASLQKLYTRGEVKNQLNNFNADVIEMLSIVTHAIEDNDLQDEAAKDLVVVAKNVEDGQAWFESQIASNKAFKGKLDKVHEETGIAPKNLTITADIVKEGRTQALKQTKEGFLPWVNRVAPKTSEGIRTGVKAVATGLLGPFAGVMGMFSDVGELAKGAYGNYSKHKQAATAAKVRAKTPPVVPGFGGQQGAGVPFAMPSSVRPRGVGQVKMSNTPIWQFFNKGAYQTKWTKELLSVLKQTKRAGARGGGPGVLGTAVGVTGALAIGKSVLPALTKAGKGLGVAGATAFAGYEAYRLAKVESDLRKANKRATDALNSLASFGEREILRIKRAGGLEAYAEKAGQTPRQVAMDIANRERWTAQKRWETRSPWKKVLGVSSFFKKPKMEPFYDRVEALEKELSTTRAMNSTRPRSDIPSRDAIMVEELKKISSNTAPKTDTTIGSSSPRNIHDSGDVMINQFLLQGLTIGGD